MRHLILLAFAAATMQTSAHGQAMISGEFPAASAISFEAVHRSVSKAFNDPSSGQYKDVVVIGEGPSQVVCGFANFRNSSGGYDAFAPFIVELRDGAARATIPHEHPVIQLDIVAHSPCASILGIKPLIP